VNIEILTSAQAEIKRSTSSVLCSPCVTFN